MRTQLTFLVKLTPGGAMSGYLADRAAVGDEISFTGPHGSFFLREIDRPVLLLAGGTGLAPILAMLRKMRTEGSHRKAHLVYGVSTDADLVELDTLSEVAAGLTGFSWDYCVSDPASTAENKGFVMSLMRPEHMYDGDVAIYLCGPPPMVEAVRKHVAEAGIEPTGFYYEKFALAPPAAAEPPPGPVIDSPAPSEELLLSPDARAMAGQQAFPAVEIDHWVGSVALTDHHDVARRIAGQLIGVQGPGDGGVGRLDEDPALLPSGARTIAGQELFPPSSVETPTPPAAATVAADGYQIGEEHPAVHESDAIFEAREALELGALELTMGRLSSQQLAGYRLLAELTLPYVEGDRFVDAAQYTETNAAFHDYLFTLTGNEHLLQAYKALGVKGRMSEVLRNAIWCHPLCAQDHVDIVSAFDRGDRDTARALIAAHADRSKQTMRRAMADALGGPATEVRHPGPVRRQGRRPHRRGSRHRRVHRPPYQRRRRHIGVGRPLRAGQGTRRRAGDRRAGHAGGHRRPRAAGGRANALVRQALSRFGRIDVLVNNVGGAINFKPFTEFTDAEIRAEIDRSLMTTLYTCRAVLPSMVARGTRASSSTSRPRPLAASTASRIRRPRAASTRSPPHSQWSTPTPAFAWSRPRLAAPKRRRGGSRGARRSPPTTPNAPGSRRISTKRSTRR